MPRKRTSRFGLAAASVAGLMTASAAAPLQAAKIKSADEECPQASAAGALKTIAAAQTDYNRSSGKKAAKKKAAKKKAARKKTAKKAAKKAVRKRAIKRPLRKKAAKKAAKRRTARRNPC